MTDTQDSVLSDWLKEQVEAERMRLASHGVRALVLPVKNCALVVNMQTQPKKPIAINRIEVDTGFQFDKIKQVLVSPPIHCPHDRTLTYRNICLYTDKPVPILLAYLYPTHHQTAHATPVTNRLVEWLFINNNGQRARMQVDRFH